jgi:hypothetical protein
MFITSRADSDISRAFEAHEHILAWELDTTSQENADDISRYLHHRILSIRTTRKYLELGDEWSGNDIIGKLSNRASGLFVWAFTASEFIDAHDPGNRLKILLKEEDASSGAELALDALYRTALESAGMWDDVDFVDDFHSVLGIILVAQTPLSHSAIDGLLGKDKHRPSMHTISLLACVLGQGPTVRVLHPSFTDFLMSRERCGSNTWYIDGELNNLRIAIQCLERLDETLKKNICNLTLVVCDTYGSLPEDLSYACLFWIEHICTISDDDLIVTHLDRFLHRHLLHWLEAMSILRRSRDTITLLDSLLGWVKVCNFISLNVVTTH